MSENFESDKLRCLVDVQRRKRDDCPEYEEHPAYKKDRRENKTAKALIKIGCNKPELRDHLLQILESL